MGRSRRSPKPRPTSLPAIRPWSNTSSNCSRAARWHRSGCWIWAAAPATISFRLAEALPSLPLLAIDGAAAMLAPALQRLAAHPDRWPRLRFLQACRPLQQGGLAALPAALQPPFQLPLSNSLLHHLHDPAVLWDSVRQLSAPGSLVVVRDLRRPDDPAALDLLVDRHAASAPPVLQRDHRASLRAAFRPEAVEEQLRHAGLGCLRDEALEDRYLDITAQLD